MRRLTIPLLAGLFLVGSIFAASCGSRTTSERAASPTSGGAAASKTPTPGRVATQPATRAAPTATHGATAAATLTAAPAATPTAAPIAPPLPTPTTTGAATPEEPTRHFELLQLCLGVSDEGWRQICAAVASRDIAKCSQMPGTGVIEKADLQAVCGFFVAAATEDASICERIGTIAPGFDPASFALGEYGADCYMYVAVASKDAALCDRTQSQAGCEHNVAVAGGAVPLDECDDMDCLFDYALRNHSSEACDKLAGMGENVRISCLAMLSGDPELCDSLQGAGVTERSACVSRALYGQARSAAGGFEFSVCRDDVICLFRALRDMAYYIAGY
jgi:hypothetical protein